MPGETIGKLKARYGVGLAALLQSRGLDVGKHLESVLEQTMKAHSGEAALSGSSTDIRSFCEQLVRLVSAVSAAEGPVYVADGLNPVPQTSAPPLSDGGAEWRSAVDAIVRQATAQPAALVADSDPVQRKFAVTVLTRAGWAVNAATTYNEIVAFAGALRYDLILLEQRWPNGLGSDAARNIRGGGGPSASAHILGCSSLDLRVECLAAGMDAYLQKPIDLASLKMRALRVASGTLRPPSEP
jgi:CheY-like chemotaxis protein